ncbi:MAG: hypothetical protein PHV32_18470 [Eubacteriales bacterium]|nr:hypothetical protein [Eubacteriales bacterium]
MKKRRKEFFDDGRVIANMNIDGMPGTGFMAKTSAPAGSFNVGAAVEQTGYIDLEAEKIKPTKRERFSVIGGIVTSYLVFGIVVFGAFALFILFCTKVWFK